jgi:hypothetical protein
MKHRSRETDDAPQSSTCGKSWVIGRAGTRRRVECMRTSRRRWSPRGNNGNARRSFAFAQVFARRQTPLNHALWANTNELTRTRLRVDKVGGHWFEPSTAHFQPHGCVKPAWLRESSVLDVPEAACGAYPGAYLELSSGRARLCRCHRVERRGGRARLREGDVGATKPVVPGTQNPGPEEPPLTPRRALAHPRRNRAGTPRGEGAPSPREGGPQPSLHLRAQGDPEATRPARRPR